MFMTVSFRISFRAPTDGLNDVWVTFEHVFSSQTSLLCTSKSRVSDGSRGTVVARWTAGQLVNRSILHQGHDSYQNSNSLVQVVPGPV